MNNSDFLIKINIDSYCKDCGKPTLKINLAEKEGFTSRTCECFLQNFSHKKYDDSALDELLKHFPEQELEDSAVLKKILDKLNSFENRIKVLEKNNKLKGVFHD